MNERFNELDSLRGLAALTVMIGHMFICVSAFAAVTLNEHMPLVNLLKYSPLHIFWAGHEAVVFFFVLSGFVLSLPFYKNVQQSYVGFIIKRYFRICLPYYVSLVFAIIPMLIFTNEVPGLSDWFNSHIQHNFLGIGLLIQHALLIGNYDEMTYNPVYWSLVDEMRISLIFPFLMFFIARWGWKRCALLLVAFPLLQHELDRVIPLSARSVVDTMEYVPMFVAGAMAAKYRVRLISFFGSLDGYIRMAIIGGSIMLYTYAWWDPYKPWEINRIYAQDFATSVGVVMFIFISLSGYKSKRILNNPAIHYIGKISYSIYLLHFTVLFICMELLHRMMPLWIIDVVVAGVSIGLSALSYKYVEVPFMKVGRKLANQLKHDPESKERTVVF